MDFADLVEVISQPFEDAYFEYRLSDHPFAVEVPFLKGESVPLAYWDNRVAPDMRLKMLKRFIEIPAEKSDVIGTYLLYNFHAPAEEYSADFPTPEDLITWARDGDDWSINGGRAPTTTDEVWLFAKPYKVEIGDVGAWEGVNQIAVSLAVDWEPEHGVTIILPDGNDLTAIEAYIRDNTPAFAR